MSAPKQYDLMTGWRVEEFANYQGHAELVGARIITDCEIVAEVVGAVICGDWGRHDLHTKRARLIAAAPDLLEAALLHRVYLALPQDRGGPDGTKGRAYQAWLDAENAAIAKATGEGA